MRFRLPKIFKKRTLRLCLNGQVTTSLRMSLRQAIRSKFRSDKSESDREMDSLPAAASIVFRSFQDEEMFLTHEDVISSGDELAVSGEKGRCVPDSCHFLFEAQLSQLQEQLVATMLENQQLQTEVNQLRAHLSTDPLATQLEKEREKYRLLTEKIAEKEREREREKDKETKDAKENLPTKSPRLRRLVRREKHFDKGRSVDPQSTPSASPSASGSAQSILQQEEGWEDLSSKESVHTGVTEDDLNEGYPNLTEGSTPPSPPSPKVHRTKSWWRQRIWNWVHDLCLELMEDFTETVLEEEEIPEADREGDPLTVKKLKENIVRFGSVTKPVSNAINSLYYLLQWKSPGTTLLAFTAYMYTIYYGWFLPLLLFLSSCQLLINYFKYRSWFTAAANLRKAELEETEKELGVSDKFQLVLHVARKVQNQLGHIADCFEKLKNLLLWRQVDVTAHLFFFLFGTFIASCIFPANQLFTAAGLYLGVKLFLVDYVFHLFPRVRHKYDSTLRMWRSLPTDGQIDRIYSRAQIDRNVLNQSSAGGSCHSLTAENQSFCELFNLPRSETPLLAWHGGRRCTLINKDKSLTSAFKNGRLYLTNSFLCFERSKTTNVKNVVLPLKNISKVEKSKPYPWMPGGGMALEVSLEKPEKTYVFGAILNRDEAYESILEAGRRAGLSWGHVLPSISGTENMSLEDSHLGACAGSSNISISVGSPSAQSAPMVTTSLVVPVPSITKTKGQVA